MEVQLKRINKFLSEVGHCSRREADKLIEAGRVTINGGYPGNGYKNLHRETLFMLMIKK